MPPISHTLCWCSSPPSPQVCPTRLFSLATLNDLLAGSSGSLCVEQWRQHTRCIGWDGWRGPVGAADEMEEDELDDQQEPEVC